MSSNTKRCTVTAHTGGEAQEKPAEDKQNSCGTFFWFDQVEECSCTVCFKGVLIVQLTGDTIDTESIQEPRPTCKCTSLQVPFHQWQEEIQFVFITHRTANYLRLEACQTHGSKVLTWLSSTLTWYSGILKIQIDLLPSRIGISQLLVQSTRTRLQAFNPSLRDAACMYSHIYSFMSCTITKPFGHSKLVLKQDE